MTIISLRDYAKSQNVSYEAIRKQVVRYKAELAGHIIMDGRQQFLDEEAVAFLDERRQKNPTVIYNQSKDETIEELRQEREKLYKQIAVLQEFKIKTLESRQVLEDARTAQERRERELQNRENGFAQELAAARQEASEAAQKAAAEKAAKDLDQVKQAHQAELEARDKKIQELENRSLWQVLTASFRKKGKKQDEAD